MKKGINNKRIIAFSGSVVAIVVIIIIALWRINANGHTTTVAKNDDTSSTLTSDTSMSQTQQNTTSTSQTQPNTTEKSQESNSDTQSSAKAVQESKTQESKAQETTSSSPRNESSDTIKRVNGIIIVNKKHKLPSNYAPGENKEAGEAFRRLIADMKNKGFAISNQYSGYRSYTYQGQLYNNYVAKNGKAKADRFSARPGYSEHQTGLAFDMLNSSGQLLGTHANDKEAVDYLAKNAHRFGFIVRYLPGKESITGYMAEAWHVRYIGEKATEIYQSGLTLEEYFNVPGGDYAS